MTRTSASFTPGPLVATTTPAQPRKCRAVFKRGRPTCQGNVNDAKAHSRYRFHSHWPGSGVRQWAQGVDGKPAPNNLPGLMNAACKVFHLCYISELFHMGILSVKLLFIPSLLKKLRHMRIQV